MRHFYNVVKHMFNSWWLQTNCSMRNLLSAKVAIFKLIFFDGVFTEDLSFFHFLTLIAYAVGLLKK